MAVSLILPLLSAAADRNWDITQPRGAVREIDFMTSEGTIQALDVAPDGNWIVFDLLAHIYRIPAVGGKAECLTQASGIALNYDPRYSPDGGQIAFISDRSGQNSLWVMGADGSNPRLVAEGGTSWIGEPAWMPDGRAIVAVRHYIRGKSRFGSTDPTQIWRFPLDGSAPERLLGEDRSFLNTPGVSPDGRYLYYGQQNTPENTDELFQVGDAHHVRRLDLTTGRSEPVTEVQSRKMYWGTPLFAVAPELDADGRQLAFMRRVPFGRTSYRGRDYAHSTGLWIRDLDSGRERLLLAPVAPDQIDTSSGYHLRLAPRYAWTRDNREIVLSQGGQIRRVEVSTGKVTTIPFEARVRRTISAQARPRVHVHDGTFETRFIRYPTSSPNGDTLLFEAVGKIWRAAPDGRAARPLLQGPDDDIELTPSWSPDGEWIAYATWSDSVGGQVWKVPAAGGAAERVSSDPAEYLHPIWSADGRSLLALRGTGTSGRFEIVRFGSDGASEYVASPASIAPPVFGPEGRLFFVEHAGGPEWSGPADEQSEYRRKMMLVSVESDGRKRREHAYFPFASDVAISPDGAFVAFREAGNILLARMPAEPGAAPPFINRDDPAVAIEWLTRTGGLDVRWRSSTQLEFASGRRYFRHDVATNETREIEMRLPIARRESHGRIALTGARLITMRDRAVIENGTIVVAGPRIECIGECDTRGVERTLDLRGKTIIPGLIDAHCHPVWDSGIVRARNPSLAAYLAYGVTTIFDPSAAEEQVFPAAELVAAGMLRGPRTFTTGPAVVPDGDVRPIRSYGNAEEDVERLASWGAVSIKQYMQPRRDQRQWLVEAARRNGAVGITGERLNLHFDLGMIMDGQTGWEHVLTEHPIHSDVTMFVASAHANYTPALQAAGQGLYPSEYWRARMDLRNNTKFRRFTPWRSLARFETLPQRPLGEYPVAFWTEAIKDILRAGGSVSVGAHGREDGIGPHWEMWTFATALSSMETLETATLHPSRYLGIDRDLGTLEPGKLADLVVLESNPLDDIRNTIDIAYVMQGGVLYDDETLDRLWPDPSPFGPRPWMFESQTQ